MKRITALAVAALIGVVGSAGSIGFAPAFAAAPAAAPEVTDENGINGTMEIVFNTRTTKDTSGDLKEGSPQKGVKDVYKFDLRVAQTTKFAGTIQRQPNLFSKTLHRRQQDALLTYSIDLAVLNPKDLKQSKNVGKWVGTVPIDTASGAYDLAAGKAQDSALRFAIDAVGKAKSFTDAFSGKLVGKAEKKADLASYTFKRLVGNKTVQVVVKKSDPMRFENIVLAMGPSENYPRCSVNGRLDYDYETGNWYTDGIRFKYTLDGADVEDVVTGSIKWIEDADRKANGKGYYDFNLRFNEDKNKKATGEGAAFEKMSDEEAFFAVDNSIPALTGRINYVDQMIGSGDDAAPGQSQVTFNLSGNKINKQQVMNFFKLWMLAVGPTNDE